MTKVTDCKDEFARQKADLFSHVGEVGSGRARYSAAMYFYNLGIVSSELLEIYRRCCKFDSEDPVILAELEGVASVSSSELELGGA